MSDNDRTRLPADYARAVAERLVERLSNTCERIDIAGSLRRQCDTVGDIDIVALPHYTERWKDPLFQEELIGLEPQALEDELQAIAMSMDVIRWARSGPRFKSFEFPSRYGTVGVDIYLAEPGGENYGALLQMRTGSADLNAALAYRAQQKRMHYRAGHGIYAADSGERLDDGTEPGIFHALDLACPLPQQRHRQDVIRTLRNGDLVYTERNRT